MIMQLLQNQIYQNLRQQTQSIKNDKALPAGQAPWPTQRSSSCGYIVYFIIGYNKEITGKSKQNYTVNGLAVLLNERAWDTDILHHSFLLKSTRYPLGSHMGMDRVYDPPFHANF